MTILFAAQTFLQSYVVRTILKVTIFVSLIAAAVYWFGILQSMFQELTSSQET